MFSLEISVDPKGLEEFEAELELRIQARMGDFAENIEWLWRQKAANVLNTTRSRYLENLKIEKSGDYEVTVSLTDPLAVAIENGSEAFDMKPGLLGGRKSRAIPIATTSGGMAIRTVPYRSKDPKHVYLPKRGNAGDPPWTHPGIGKGPGSPLFNQGTPGQQVLKELDGVIDETFGNLFGSENV